MSGKSKRKGPHLHPRRGPRPHETAKLDQSFAGLRDMQAKAGIPGAMRAAANGEQCCWCDCPIGAHLQQAVRLVTQGADPNDVNAFGAALKTDGMDYCNGCGNPAMTKWTFTDQQIAYPICEQHEPGFIRDITARYGGRALVVPQRIYDNDII
jgi:hypothetical protein